MYSKFTIATFALSFLVVVVGYFGATSWNEAVFLTKNAWEDMARRYHASSWPEDSTNAATHQPSHSTREYVNAILGLEQATVPRLKCPAPDAERYKPIQVDTSAEPGIDYIFAVAAVNDLDQLATILGSIVEAIRFLGPDRCALSVVYSGWNEQADKVFEGLRDGIESLGAVYNYTPISRGPFPYKQRNQAIGAVRYADKEISEDATIVVVDDVDICGEDLLELILQRKTLGADMTCSMSWAYHKSKDLALFKNDGSCRDMQGDKFGAVVPETWTEEKGVREYFWKSPHDQARFNENRPFQVFSCWGGAVAFTASAFTKREQAFRLSSKGAECDQPDTRLFCKDMRSHGRGKIAVVPSVNVAFSVGDFNVKRSKGYTSDLVQDLKGDRIAWVEEPPEKVFCSKREWEAWDEGLPLDDPWDDGLEEEWPEGLTDVLEPWEVYPT